MSVDHHPMDQMADGLPGTCPSVDRDPTVKASPSPSASTDPPTGKPAKQKPCTCAAYRWPHRPGGGLCRWPDPPMAQHPTPAGSNRSTGLRRRGLRKWIISEHGLHPIRDREAIERVLPVLYAATDRGQFPTVVGALAMAGRGRPNPDPAQGP